ncbi:hypothetical protein K438DRAFT_499777 [Mycena galopus ATCC 62051]|nr:hypothetical protein K438DRAFT_499777 [Mycena galopus ATCC 62051]
MGCRNAVNPVVSLGPSSTSRFVVLPFSSPCPSAHPNRTCPLSPTTYTLALAPSSALTPAPRTMLPSASLLSYAKRDAPVVRGLLRTVCPQAPLYHQSVPGGSAPHTLVDVGGPLFRGSLRVSLLLPPSSADCTDSGLIPPDLFALTSLSDAVWVSTRTPTSSGSVFPPPGGHFPLRGAGSSYAGAGSETAEREVLLLPALHWVCIYLFILHFVHPDISL